MKSHLVASIVAAAAFASSISTAGAVIMVTYTQNFGAVTDPAEADVVTSNWQKVGKPAGFYNDYVIFNVTGPNARFDIAVSETNNGTSAGSDYYSSKGTFDSGITLYRCAAVNCGYTNAMTEPTGGTAVPFADADISPLTAPAGAFSQSAFFAVSDLPKGAYYVALLGYVSSPGVGTYFTPVVTAAITGDPAPEPASWLLLLLGFAGIGLGGYRAPRKTSTAISS